MRICVPVSKADLHLLPLWVELYIKLGGSPKQSVWFFPTLSCLSEATTAATQIASFAKTCEVIPWSDENINPWPLAGNNMFIHTVFEIQKRGDTEPWYFMELDNTMMASGWPDKLEAEYILSGCKFMGAVVPTRKHPPGKPQEVWIDQADTHMVGTGIYPANINHWTDGQYKFARLPDAWDLVIRNYVRRSCHHTRLIDHHWSTINYREEEGKIVCDNDPNNPFGTDHSGAVSAEAIVVHGSKDGSLQRLVLSRLGDAPIPKRAEGVTEKIPVAVMPPSNPNKPKIHYDRGAWQNFKAHETPTPALKPVEPDGATVSIQSPPFPFPAQQSQIQEAPKPQAPLFQDSDEDRIIDIIRANPKTMRAQDVAKQAGMNVGDLRRLAGDANAPFEVSKIGWVKERKLEHA